MMRTCNRAFSRTVLALALGLPAAPAAHAHSLPSSAPPSPCDRPAAERLPGSTPPVPTRVEAWDAGTRSPWKRLSAAGLQRAEVASARIGRFIYVAGGLSCEEFDSSPSLERYDIRSNRWQRLSSMPLKLNHAAAVAYRGDLYMIGGFRFMPTRTPPIEVAGFTGEVPAFLRYDPASDRWSRLPDAPTARAAHVAGVIGNKLYVAGGQNDAEGLLGRLDIYDFRSRRWTRGPDLPTPRHHSAAAVVGGALYVLGGRDVDPAQPRGGSPLGRNYADAERHVPTTGRWERLPSLGKARSGAAAAAVCGGIAVFGGEEVEGTIARVELYDPAARTWRRLPEMRTPRHGLGGASLGRRLYAVVGGRTWALSTSSTLEALDVACRKAPAPAGGTEGEAPAGGTEGEAPAGGTEGEESVSRTGREGTAAAGDSGQGPDGLAATGLGLAVLALLGVVALGSGLALRRRGRPPR